MQCSLFHERINELLDERTDPSQDVEIQQHAASCGICRSQLKGYQTFVQVFEPTSTVVHKLPEQRHTLSRIWLTAAATLLIAVVVANRQQNPEPSASAGPLHVATVPPVVKVDEAVAGGNFVQPILGISLVANADWSGLEQVEMPFGVPMPQVETDWIHSVADEMVPIKQSVDSTFSLIMRTLST